MADARGLESDRGGEIIALPERLGSFLDAEERAVELVAIGETQQIRRSGGGETGQDEQAWDDGDADHFS